MKRFLLLFTALTLVFSLGFADIADAKRGGLGGGYKSPKRSFEQQTPAKPADNVNRVDSGKTSTSSGGATTTGTTAPTANRGFFSGGSLAKGLMIGGIAGMLFGSMLAGLGAFGDFLGLLINLLVLYVLFVAVRGIIRYFRDNNQRKTDPPRPYRS